MSTEAPKLVLTFLSDVRGAFVKRFLAISADGNFGVLEWAFELGGLSVLAVGLIAACPYFGFGEYRLPPEILLALLYLCWVMPEDDKS